MEQLHHPPVSPQSTQAVPPQPRKSKPPRTATFNWVSVAATFVGGLPVALNLVLYVPSLLIGMTDPDSINTLEIEWLARSGPVVMGLGIVLLIATVIFYFGARNANNRGFVRSALIVNIANIVMLPLIFLLAFMMFSTALIDDFIKSLN